MRVLYISYDGMTDPLGRSQVIPYLEGLSRLGHDITLMSFEKPDRREKSGQEIAVQLKAAGIHWHPLTYHASPPVLSTLKDLRCGKHEARRLHAEKPFELIHCRSYISALIGRMFRKHYGIPFLFDMRGFWADERVEGGLWNLRNPLFRAVYRYFKKKERSFFSESAHIVSLTEAGKAEILKLQLPEVHAAKITVIPCCTDMELFKPGAGHRELALQQTGIPQSAMVITYLGSFGTWYMAEEMLDFFSILKQTVGHAVFLIITRDAPDPILAMAAARGLTTQDLVIRPAERLEVPGLLALSTCTIFFIRPTFSKRASSPTKMGEALSMGIPVICNDGIGDCTTILQTSGAGTLVSDFTEAAYRQAALAVAGARYPSPDSIREAAARHFDLRLGIRRYHDIYGAIAAEGVHKPAKS